MAAKNPRLIQVNSPLPVLIVGTVGAPTTGTALTTDPGTGIEYVTKQIILCNMGAAANVVFLYLDTTTTVSTAERIVETSVPADSTTILYMTIRIPATYELYGVATAASEVNVMVLADAEVA